ncbi:hypothetical protein Alexa_012 [Acinetobacter phage vB_AbaP_Alexa]|nr:hypothetical protein Alexa_012 [Acinetobacter phage vB_AbaP_Alexa]
MHYTKLFIHKACSLLVQPSATYLYKVNNI